ncbi:MAG: hypothetical protein QM756_47240 [Polyangiaceae bacterium]
MRNSWKRAAVCLIGALAFGCGSDSKSTDGGGGGASSTSGGSGSEAGATTQGGSSANGGSTAATQGGSGGIGGSGTGNGGASTGGASSAVGAFRYGFNAGYPNPAFNDQDLAGLGVRSGVTSQRVSLPEQHLDKWGYEIELSDVKGYRALGMGELVGFLTSPTRAHSSAPTSATDDQVGFYIPKNLYEPIVGSDGKVNPDNYWANYVFRAVSTYGEWIKVWEVWNEPDWVADWQTTLGWTTSAPTAAQLPRFNGSVFDYVRMLRVSQVAARLADPKAKIATGGLGYASFLDAVLRYTDEPTQGKIDGDHPSTGAGYIDVLSFHHYPIYTTGNSEAGVDGFLKQQQTFAALVNKAGISVGWECTETGAPHVALTGVPSGPDYAKNYLMKAMTLAQSVGIGGVHWFNLADGKAAGASTDPYAFMGLYMPVGSLSKASDATLNDSGVAYATLTQLLRDARYDADSSAAVSLPATARGAVFSKGDGKRVFVLWAVPTAGSESGSAELDLGVDGALNMHTWDFSKTQKSQAVTVTGGFAHVVLEATPRLFVEP